MNFIDECFASNSKVLQARLEGVGFTPEQSARFLPAAATGILNSFHHRAIEEIIAAIGMTEPDRLLNAVNVRGIAEDLGINAYQIASGFEVIAPVMATAFLYNSRGIVGAAASVAWGSNAMAPDLAEKTDLTADVTHKTDWRKQNG